MDFGILGSLLVRDETGTHLVGAAKQRILLAALLLRPGQVVPVDALADTLWDGRPPRSAATSVRNYVMRLRNGLGPAGERISSRPGGYLAEVGPDELDLLRFEQLRARGAEALDAGAVERAAALLGQAVGLWRGPALADVPSDTLHRDEGPRLAESRLTALELKLEAEGRLGRPGPVIAELQALTAAHPERERLWVQLMTALYRSGRQSEALAAYRRIHRILAEEVGVGPGPELRELHRRILSADPALGVGGARTGPERIRVSDRFQAGERQEGHGRILALVREEARVGAMASARGHSRQTPGIGSEDDRAQLQNGIPANENAVGGGNAQNHRPQSPVRATDASPPGPITSVTAAGSVMPRTIQPSPTRALPMLLAVTPFQAPADLADFTGRACETDDLSARLTAPARPTAAPVAVVLTGPAGIGKSALAIHVAHAVRPAFPDGVLYADLRGTDRVPTAPRAVLASFLRALGFDAGAIPLGLDDRAALLRSVLADRRLLIVLDNAADGAQVRPLLPGTASSATVITSRRRLTDLAVGGQVDLELLTPREAAHLLGRIVGQGRAQAEPLAVAEVAGACDRLPLALRIAGARLAARPRWEVRHLADRLADGNRLLDELATGGLDVRSRFASGYRALDAASARVFRQVALLNVPIVRTEVAAALLDDPVDRIEALLEGLVDAQLLTSSQPGCYSYLSLVRVYARELAREMDPEAERARAIDRATRELSAHKAPMLPPTYAGTVLRVAPGHLENRP